MSKNNECKSLACKYFNPALGLRNHNQKFVAWHIQKHLSLLSKGMDIVPITFEIDLVNFCNHSCKWCLDVKHGNSILPLDLIRSFSNEIKTFSINGTRCQGILFKGGGEPTLHPDFIRCIEYINDTGCDLGLLTNGSQLYKTEIRNVINQYLCHVRISLDAGTSDSHSRTHKSDDFEEIVYGTKHLIKERKNRSCQIGLTFIFEPEMSGGLASIIKIVKEIEPDYIQLRMPYLEEVLYTPDFEEEQWRKTHEEMLISLKDDIGIPIYLSDYMPSPIRQEEKEIPLEKHLHFCIAHKLMGVLTGDCLILGCCEHRNLSEYQFGKLSYPDMPLEKIWKSKKRFSALEKMDNAHCISSCTYPVSLYNDAILALCTDASPFSSFV